MLVPEITGGKAMKKPGKKSETLLLGAAADLDDLPDDPGELLEQAAAELMGGGGGSVRIERMKQGGKWEYIDEWSLDSFSLSELQRVFGGGDYLLRLRDSQKRYFKQARVLVAEPPASKKDPAAVAAPDPIVAALTKQTELLGQVLAKLAAPPTDVRNGLLDDLVKFKAILGGSGGGERGGFKETMEAVSAVLDFSKNKLGGGDGGGSGFWDVMRELATEAGGPIGRAIERAVVTVSANAAAGQGGDPARVALPGAGAAGASSIPGEQGAAMKIPPRYVAMLVEKAIEGSDPALYADLIVDNVPEDMIRAVLKGGIVPTLAAVDARVTASAQWFEQLGAVLSSALEIVPDASQSGGAAPADG